LESATDLWIPFLVDSRRYPSIFDVVRDSYGIKKGARGYNHLLHRSSDDAAALRASASQFWRNSGATCAQIRAPVASKGEHACDVFARIGSSRSLVWRRCAP